MARFATQGRLGISLELASATALHALGFTCTGYDTVSGAEGEFMYVKANVAFAEGDCVYINLSTEAVLADSDVHANDGGPIGWALATCAIDDYVFVQVAGNVKAKAAADAAANAKVFLTANAGIVDDAAIAGCQVLGAEFGTLEGTPADTFSYITCDRPHVQGQDAVV